MLHFRASIIALNGAVACYAASRQDWLSVAANLFVVGCTFLILMMEDRP